jgi:hypothetical protein
MRQMIKSSAPGRLKESCVAVRRYRYFGNDGVEEKILETRLTTLVGLDPGRHRRVTAREQEITWLSDGESPPHSISKVQWKLLDFDKAVSRNGLPQHRTYADLLTVANKGCELC